MIIDSHTHIDNRSSLGIGIEERNPAEFDDFKQCIEEKKLVVLANAACPAEFDELSKIGGIFTSFGIHPWSTHEFCHYSDESNSADYKQIQGHIQREVNAMEAYYKKAHAVGEIGMDSVWCTCDLTLQRELFMQQLNLAEKLGKPVILHTKGQEREIGEILRHYSVKKLVHWYSCEQYLENFIGQDCYFTVGPNYTINNAVKHIISSVPLDRLLVETDGISAVEWAVGRKTKAADIPAMLRGAIEAIAVSKNISADFAEKSIEENFYRFLEI